MRSEIRMIDALFVQFEGNRFQKRRRKNIQINNVDIDRSGGNYVNPRIKINVLNGVELTASINLMIRRLENVNSWHD